MKHVQIRLDDGLSDWVDANFGHGFKQAFGEACFTRLRKTVEDSKGPMIMITPAQVAEHTVTEILNADRTQQS